ncbi:MAG: hypothetical protein ACN4E2_02855 [Nitrospinota bacterium]
MDNNQLLEKLSTELILREKYIDHSLILITNLENGILDDLDNQFKIRSDLVKSFSPFDQFNKLLNRSDPSTKVMLQEIIDSGEKITQLNQKIESLLNSKKELLAKEKEGITETKNRINQFSKYQSTKPTISKYINKRA